MKIQISEAIKSQNQEAKRTTAENFVNMHFIRHITVTYFMTLKTEEAAKNTSQNED
jgi:hypothetical protein